MINIDFDKLKELYLEKGYSVNKCAEYFNVSKFYQKKKINCPENMSVQLYCESLGYYKIWDCGKKRWIWNP